MNEGYRFSYFRAYCGITESFSALRALLKRTRFGEVTVLRLEVKFMLRKRQATPLMALPSFDATPTVAINTIIVGGSTNFPASLSANSSLRKRLRSHGKNHFLFTRR
jgi:hypothetical protein